MQQKKIDYPTLFDLIDHAVCESKYNCDEHKHVSVCYSRDCPIWQGLDDVGNSWRWLVEKQKEAFVSQKEFEKEYYGHPCEDTPDKD